jgi:low affinity iron permease
MPDEHQPSCFGGEEERGGNWPGSGVPVIKEKRPTLWPHARWSAADCGEYRDRGEIIGKLPELLRPSRDGRGRGGLGPQRQLHAGTNSAVQAKLDELIRVSRAQNTLIGIEHLTQDEISDIADKCLALAKKAGNAQRSANKKAQAAISKTV